MSRMKSEYQRLNTGGQHIRDQTGAENPRRKRQKRKMMQAHRDKLTFTQQEQNQERETGYSPQQEQYQEQKWEKEGSPHLKQYQYQEQGQYQEQNQKREIPSFHETAEAQVSAASVSGEGKKNQSDKRAARKKQAYEFYASQQGQALKHQQASKPEQIPSTPKPKSPSRLRFANGEITAVAGKAVTVAARSGEAVIRRKVSEQEQDNVAVESLSKTSLALENGVRTAEQASAHPRLRHKRVQNAKAVSGGSQGTTAQKAYMKRQRRKRQVVEAQKPESPVEALLHLSRTFRKENKVFAVRHSGFFIHLVGIVLVLVLLLTQFSACAPIFLTGAQTIVATSWLSADGDINAAEEYYTALEAELQQQVNTVEQRYPGYDQYRYNVGEIGHSPVELVSYLSVLQENGIFQFNDGLKDALDSLFAEQYTLSVDTFTEEQTTTRTVHAGESLGTVVTSAYCNCPICCGQWSGGPTASGVYPTSNHTLAVDAHNPTVPMGTEIIMNGTLYKVEDTGNFARYGVDFDVYMDSHSEAQNWGHRSFEAYLAGGDGEEIEITTTEEVSVCAVTVHQKPFSQMVSELTEEQQQQYQIYVESKGNRPFMATPVEYDWTASVVGMYGKRCEGNRIIQHDTLDISMPAGTEVFTPLNGTVSTVGSGSVTIQSERGYEVTYSSLGTVSVRRGQAVEKGDTIGKTGSGALKLSFSQNGTPYNPYFYFQTGTGYAIGAGVGVSGHPAMGDAAFQSMLTIAEAQLGTPYVWGGSSPGGFDCSGFVCYVLNQSGVRNVGRATAQGLYDLCSPVSLADARPGDLIFFTGTYRSSNPVTHVGIYVGNGQMIHAGDPIHYSSINTSYWQSHYYAMGRP